MNTDNIINEYLGADIDEDCFKKQIDLFGIETDYSFDLIFNNFIKSQITQYHTKNTINAPITNYLNTVKDKIDFLKTCAPVDPESYDKAKKAYSSLLISVLTTIEETFDIDLNQLMGTPYEDLSLNELEDCTFALYNFVVIDRYTNLKNFFINYIFDNRDLILKEYSLLERSKNKKNLSISSLKKTFKNFDDTLVIYTLNEIIEELLKYEITLKDFYQYIEERAGLYYNAILFSIIDTEDSYIIKNCMEFFSKNKFALDQLVYDIKYSLSTKFPKK